ncbi:MAG: matrixin family metalloprotease [Nitrosarchaeum sp.]|nr:matrixin family metalloprotease [Nitrosarchaeum sp.]
MNFELVSDLISKNVLLEEINSARKRQVLESTKRNSESTEQKTIAKHATKYPIKYFAILAALAVSFLLFSQVGMIANSDHAPLSTQYLIQNLKGDTTETWVSWNLTPNKSLTFTIIGESLVTPEQIIEIKDVILSEKSLQIDNSLLHKGLKGTSSTYYIGWKGAMDQVSKNPTKMVVPNKFEYVSSDNGVADITIKLVTQRNGDGYSGYTNSVVDNNQILKSTITIYNITELSSSQITTILRHEFGHALGLAHSTAPEELMSPTITTDYPYISPCTVNAIEKLYDGNQKSEVVCDI